MAFTHIINLSWSLDINMTKSRKNWIICHISNWVRHCISILLKQKNWRNHYNGFINVSLSKSLSNLSRAKNMMMTPPSRGLKRTHSIAQMGNPPSITQCVRLNLPPHPSYHLDDELSWPKLSKNAGIYSLLFSHMDSFKVHFFICPPVSKKSSNNFFNLGWPYGDVWLQKFR